MKQSAQGKILSPSREGKIVSTENIYDKNLDKSQDEINKQLLSGDIGSGEQITVIKLYQGMNMILNPEDCGYPNRNNMNNVVAWIKANSHCYAARYRRDTNIVSEMPADSEETTMNEYMEIVQLYDGDHLYFADEHGKRGVPVENYMSIMNNKGIPISNLYIEKYLKLPRFFYKTVNEVDSDGKESGVVNLIFARENYDGTYLEWDTNTLIGCNKGGLLRCKNNFTPAYEDLECCLYSPIINNDNDSYLSIRENEWRQKQQEYPDTPSIIEVFKTLANNRNFPDSTSGNKFSLIDYKVHNIMALLYFAYYGGLSMDCRGLIGLGNSTYREPLDPDFPLELPEARGMSITRSNIDGDKGISFWGLINWWSEAYEPIDKLTVDYHPRSQDESTCTFNMLDEDGNIERSVETYKDLAMDYFFTGFPYPENWMITIGRLKFGEYADVLPMSCALSDSEVIGNGYSELVYCTQFNDTGYALRSGQLADAGGVIHLYITSPDFSGKCWINPDNTIVTGRIMYKGNIKETIV